MFLRVIRLDILELRFGEYFMENSFASSFPCMDFFHGLRLFTFPPQLLNLSTPLMNVQPMKDFSFKISKQAFHKTKAKNCMRRSELCLILMSSFLLSQPPVVGLFPHPFPPFIIVRRGSERNQNEQLCVFCLVHETKARVEAAKSRIKRREQKEKKQRILISDYIDKIISQLDPLLFSRFFIHTLFVGVPCYLLNFS